MDSDSVTRWLREMEEGDQDAARKLWEKYGDQLIGMARRRHRGALTPSYDEEDLVQSVFRELWTSSKDMRLTDVKDRDSLWWLLVEITRRRAINRRRHDMASKRGSGRSPLRFECGSDNLQDSIPMPADEKQPPPELILILHEEVQDLLSRLLDDTLRAIAHWRLEGLTIEEIASKLGLSGRSVLRKLEIIRSYWEDDRCFTEA